MANSTLFDADWKSVSDSVLKTQIVLFMHGMYVILVVAAFCLLYRRKPSGVEILAFLIAAMCIFASAGTALQAITTNMLLRLLHSTHVDPTALDVQASLQHGTDLIKLAEELLVVTNNAIADSLLIYRCCVIWNTTGNYVTVLPILLALGSTASGYMAAYQAYTLPTSAPDSDPRIFLALVIATNLTITCLTVGRILYQRWNLRVIGQTKIVRRYNTAVKLMLESSVIYLICGCAIIIERALAGSDVLNVFYGISPELMNMIPPLLIIQVSLATNVDTKSNMCGTP
ncbi:hypothetical protein DFH09DRAFT_339444 [Mycena vulgaris]|nr:hypothetical protein DFH09DRAFT_339444 [Mycena vulgaris]